MGVLHGPRRLVVVMGSCVGTAEGVGLIGALPSRGHWRRSRITGLRPRRHGAVLAIYESGDGVEVLPTRRTPPETYLAAHREPNGRGSGFDRVDAVPFLIFHGGHSQSHPFSDRAGEKAPNRMGLPAGGFYQLFRGNAARLFKQIQDLGGFAVVARFPRLCRVGVRAARRRFLSMAGLLAGLGGSGRNTRAAWRKVGLSGGFRRDRRGRVGSFRMFDHLWFSYRGCYRVMTLITPVALKSNTILRYKDVAMTSATI